MCWLLFVSCSLYGVAFLLDSEESQEHTDTVSRPSYHIAAVMRLLLGHVYVVEITDLSWRVILASCGNL